MKFIILKGKLRMFSKFKRTRVDVLVLYEHLNREIESLIIIKHELEKRGFKVLIKSIFFDYWEIINKYEVDVVITPWCYDDRDLKKLTAIRDIENKGLMIINLHHEQLAVASAENFLLPKGNAKKTYHISWGNHFTQKLISVGVLREQILQIGSIRLDFYKKGLRFFSSSKEELAKKYNLDHTKQWILIIGNFTYAFLFDEQLDKLTSKGYVTAKLFSDECKKTYPTILDWIVKLAEEYIDAIEIIYRPHPTEKISEQLNRICENHNSISIITGNAVRDWILSCDVNFIWTSTTIVESLISQKPVYILRPYEMPDQLIMPIVEKVPRVTSVNEFLDVINKNLLSPQLNVEVGLSKEIEKYYHIEERCSYEILIETMENILNQPSKRLLFKHENINLINLIYEYVKHLSKHNLSTLNKFKMLRKFSIMVNEKTGINKIEEIEGSLRKNMGRNSCE